jgi:hypothetical protein
MFSSFVLAVLGLELRTYTLSHSLFCEGFFQDGFLQNYLPGWLQTVILVISDSL